MACGSDSSTFEPPVASSSGTPGTSSGTFDPGPQRDGGSSGRPVQPGCGNAFLEEGEICDDANRVGGDGCSADCKTVEAGYQCLSEGAACVAICGDGVLLGDEDCDDGNTKVGDGCSDGCRLEPGFKCVTAGAACVATTCGDGIVEGTEQCDDLVTADSPDRPYDGCFQCVKEPSCGNQGCIGACGDGLLFPNEACDDGNTRDGDGCSSTCTLETGFTCDNRTEDPPAELALPVMYRDFLSPWNPATPGTYVENDEAKNTVGHPDFESFIGYGAYEDLVEAALGADGRPVFKQTSAAASTCITSNTALCGSRQQLTGPSEFAEWYNDGARSKLVLSTLRLPRQAGTDSYVFDSALPPYGQYRFFPLDANNPENTGVGYGTQTDGVCRDPFGTPNQGRTTRAINCYGVNASPNPPGYTPDTTPHNFLYTTELRFWFTYRADSSPELNFTGDDDVWVFVNGRRVIDLGGLHSPLGRSVTVDPAKAGELGLTDGNVYEISLFHAERHSNASNFKFTLRGFVKTRTFCEPKCGDGVKTKNETCDDGILAGGYNQCGPGCVWGPRCGDGITQPEFGEACDDGNFLLNDGCLPTCQLGDTIN